MNNNNVDELRNGSKIINVSIRDERKPAEKAESEKFPEHDIIKRKRMIYDIMKNMGIPANILGYKYVIEAIELVLDGKVGNAVTKELYPTIAKKFNTTGSRVERAIRHAIERAMINADVDYIEKMFGYTISATRGKPTNSEFIYGIVSYINLREECDSRGVSRQIRNLYMDL